MPPQPLSHAKGEPATELTLAGGLMTAVAEGSQKGRVLTIWGVLIGGAVLFAIVPYLTSRSDSDELEACDLAIQARLKAPATYERISASGSEGTFYITYDAQNAFGVPLRSFGSCEVTGGVARWTEIGGA